MSETTEKALSDIKTLIVDLKGTVQNFDAKLDRVESKLTCMIDEVKTDVVQVKKELKGTQDQVVTLREEHNELERGVAAMELQFSELQMQKMEHLRKSIDIKLSALRENQILLEKHERKYNILIYGLKEETGENIGDRLYSFMTNDLGIDKDRADGIPIANAHRIPTKNNTQGPKPIIVRFVHYGDKQFVMSRGNKLSGKKIRILDDLPPCMKDARNVLANMAYKIRN